MATEMKLAKDNIEAIQIAGIIHDSGKIFVPADILSKRTKLNENEINLIMEHPLINKKIPWKGEFNFWRGLRPEPGFMNKFASVQIWDDNGIHF